MKVEKEEQKKETKVDQKKLNDPKAQSNTSNLSSNVGIKQQSTQGNSDLKAKKAQTNKKVGSEAVKISNTKDKDPKASTSSNLNAKNNLTDQKANTTEKQGSKEQSLVKPQEKKELKVQKADKSKEFIKTEGKKDQQDHSKGSNESIKAEDKKKQQDKIKAKDSKKGTKNNKKETSSKPYDPLYDQKKKKGIIAKLTLFRFKNIPVVNLVYIGFSILIFLLIIVSASSFIKFTTLKYAFQEVTEKATPIVLNADRMEADLISTHKSLVDILTATNSEDIKKLTAIYENERVKLSESNNQFLESVKGEKVFEEPLAKLESNLTEYLAVTAEIPHRYLDWSVKNAESAIRISKFRALVSNFGGAFASIQRVIEEEDDFVYQETQTLEITKGLLTTKVDEALSSRDTQVIKGIIDSIQNPFKQFSALIKDIERDWPDFKNEVGGYYTPFINDISQEKGVLLNHFRIIQTQDELKDLTTKANERLEILRDSLSQIASISNNAMTNSVGNAYNVITHSYFELGIILVIGIFVAMLVALIVGRVIRIPLQRIVNSINAMCDCDMTQKVRYTARSEFGVLAYKINKLIDVFHDMLGQIAKSSDTLKASARDNSESMLITSQKIKEQLDQTSLIDKAMEALKQASDNVASSAETSLNEIIVSNDTAENGRKLMSDNITTNHLLASKLKRTTDAVKDVRNMSDNINQIVEVIKSIANQTNLLALNAAIESARAGEYGRGFAVVADQVRSLAQKTSEATHDVQSLIESLHKVVDDAVQNIQDCGEEMEHSVMQTSEVNSSIEELKAILTSISDMAHQIASAAEQQRSTTVEINRNVEKISVLSDENAVEIDKAKESSLILDGLATEQKQLVSKFKF